MTLFGLGLEPGLADVPHLLPRATAADTAGLDVVSIPDHPNYADQVDAYAGRWAWSLAPRGESAAW